MQPTIRYGVVRNGRVFSAWQAACIDELERSGLARLSCIINHDCKPVSNAFERYRATLQLPSQACVECDFPGVSIVEPSDAAAQKLDFILSFADTDELRDLVDAAKYGVWSFAYGDSPEFGSSIAGFWEVYYDRDVTCATLVKAGRDGDIVLRRGCFPTVRESFRHNAEQIFADLPTWPVQICRDIACGVASYFENTAAPHAAVRLGIPNAAQIAAMRVQEAKSATIRYLRIHLFSIDWSVFALKGWPEKYIGRDAHAEVTSLRRYTKGRYLADPCAVKHRDATFVLCEEYNHQYDRGRIVAFELNGGEHSPRVAIEEPYHLSFPQVFEHDGETLCIAETAALRSLGLYRAVEFPYRWRYVRTLLENVRAVDTSILRFNGKWWLFCTSGKGPRSGDQSHLYIWHAPDLFGPWTPHGANPVKIDVRSARPAGPFFEHDGQLYRPAQDCSRTYGGALRINRVEKLTEFEFEETVVGRIRPPTGVYSRGIHTLSCAGEWCIVDAKRYVFNPSGILTICKDAARAVMRANRIAPSART